MGNSKLFLGADHAGFELKEAVKKMLERERREFEDLGAHDFDVDDDYPDFAKAVCEKIQKEGGKGILICGTGQGMAITANKFPGIRASVCWNEKTIEVAAEHNKANIICLGGKILSKSEGMKLVKLWIKSEFTNEPRHIRRIKKIEAIEKDEIHSQ